MKHILLQKALKYKIRKEIEEPRGYLYENKLGAWVNKVTMALLIQSSDYPAMGTKKEDIETGEDQKGH